LIYNFSIFEVASDSIRVLTEIFSALLIDRASIQNKLVIREIVPITNIKIVARPQPPITKTQGTINGPVPSMTFITVIDVTMGFYRTILIL
jgi:hypothetical protein